MTGPVGDARPGVGLNNPGTRAEIGNGLRAIRVASEISLRHLAIVIGMGDIRLAEIERGTLVDVQMDQIVRIMRGLAMLMRVRMAPPAHILVDDACMNCLGIEPETCFFKGEHPARQGGRA